jgi:hypothetical protein
MRTYTELGFRAKGEISAGTVEGLNNKIRVVTRTILRFPPHLRSDGNRATSHAGKTSGVRNQPIDFAEEAYPANTANSPEMGGLHCKSLSFNQLSSLSFGKGALL